MNASLRRHFPHATKIFRQQRGAALMMALSAIVLMTMIAFDLMQESTVEYATAANSIHQVRASYAAKSAVELSLLRIHLYQKVSARIGSSMPQLQPLLNMIWQMPFAWPPPVLAEMNLNDQSALREVIKSSGLQGQFIVRIEPESSKININAIGALRESDVERASGVQALVRGLFGARLSSDEVFAARHRNTNFDDLVANIADWVDRDKTRLRTQGDESAAYPTGLPGEPMLPPNQGFKSVQELHMVAGMLDDFVSVLEPQITLFGSSTINLRTASKDILRSLTPAMTEQRAAEIIKQRDDPKATPWTRLDDFLQAAQSVGIPPTEFVDQQTRRPRLPIEVSTESSFRITATGRSGPVQRDITAVVFDRGRALAQARPLPAPCEGRTPPLEGDALKRCNEDREKELSRRSSPNGGAESRPDQGPARGPNVVFWQES
jgi:general secretion pathway protein K